MSTPQTPTAAQLAQLAVLQATQQAASVALTAAQQNLATLTAVYVAAAKNVQSYQHYIYGGKSYPGVLDNGNPQAV